MGVILKALFYLDLVSSLVPALGCVECNSQSCYCFLESRLEEEQRLMTHPGVSGTCVDVQDT